MPNCNVPVADPRGDQAELRAKILDAVASVIDSGVYILGQNVMAFEADMMQRVGGEDAIGVASGTDGLTLALQALGVLPGDEVVTVSHTAGPTVSAILQMGAIPVLVDVDLENYCLAPEALAKAISPRTKAIVVVHLYGHPADMPKISDLAVQHRLAVIEDCAQAQGATVFGRAVGSISDAGCFSFYPTKNLGAIGDAGLVVARDKRVGDRIRQLRVYGWSTSQYAILAGGRSSRLDELQAAILRVKLRYLDSNLERRRHIADRYNRFFSDLPLVLPKTWSGFQHAYHQYVVRCDARDDLARFLAERGIGTGIHYRFPVHLQPAFSSRSQIPFRLVNTEAISAQILSLPVYPTLSQQQQDLVIGAVRSFFGKR